MLLAISNTGVSIQGTHCTGKMVQKIHCRGKHGEFENFAKTQGIWFAQVLSIQNIFLYFPRKFPNSFLKLVSLPSQFCVCTIKPLI